MRERRSNPKGRFERKRPRKGNLMNRANLSVYLNDHLAASGGAITHLDHLIALCEDKQLEAFLRSLRLEIEADQDILKKLIKDIGEKESGVRKAGAWIAEKLSRVKLGGS